MRYEFTSHPEKAGWYMVTDTKWMLTCEFREHEFNETRVFSGLERIGADPEKISRAMREMGDWLCLHHYHEAMPASAFELKLSEDDTELHIIRRKHPQMDAVFSTDDLEAIAKTLAKASEFVRKRLIRR